MVAPVLTTSPPLPETAVPMPMEAIREFCQRRRVICFELFGSVLRDDFRDDSDIDVMVTFEHGAHPTLLTLASMAIELEKLFGRKVDLLTRRGVEQMRNPYRRAPILREARTIYAR
jgi:predicted nucleotidyltransferase